MDWRGKDETPRRNDTMGTAMNSEHPEARSFPQRLTSVAERSTRA